MKGCQGCCHWTAHLLAKLARSQPLRTAPAAAALVIAAVVAAVVLGGLLLDHLSCCLRHIGLWYAALDVSLLYLMILQQVKQYHTVKQQIHIRTCPAFLVVGISYR